MYKITIKGYTPNTFTYAQVKEEIIEEITVNDADGNPITAYKPTGKFKLVDFATEDVEEVKTKYLELLKNHLQDELNIIQDCVEIVTTTVDIEIENSNLEEDVTDEV